MKLRRSISNQVCMGYTKSMFWSVLLIWKRMCSRQLLLTINTITLGLLLLNLPFRVQPYRFFNMLTITWVYLHSELTQTILEEENKTNFQYHTQIFSQQFQENQKHQFPLTLIQIRSSGMDLHLHTVTVFKTSSHLLPFITELVTAPATVRNTANMVKAITENINPGQPVVITADEPVYALGKQLQWIFPDEFRDFVWMLGPLHIEKNFIKAIGD